MCFRSFRRKKNRKKKKSDDLTINKMALSIDIIQRKRVKTERKRGKQVERGNLPAHWNARLEGEEADNSNRIPPVQNGGSHLKPRLGPVPFPVLGPSPGEAHPHQTCVEPNQSPSQNPSPPIQTSDQTQGQIRARETPSVPQTLGAFAPPSVPAPTQNSREEELREEARRQVSRAIRVWGRVAGSRVHCAGHRDVRQSRSHEVQSQNQNQR